MGAYSAKSAGVSDSVLSLLCHHGLGSAVDGEDLVLLGDGPSVLFYEMHSFTSSLKTDADVEDRLALRDEAGLVLRDDVPFGVLALVQVFCIG